jgi:hypothetical protein
MKVQHLVTAAACTGMKDKAPPAAGRPQLDGYITMAKHDIKESFKLNRTFWFLILALVPAALMPLAARSQVAPDRGSRSVDQGDEPSFKYEVFAGYGYTGLNQVNQSRSGLSGGEVTITRNFGKYFGIEADGAYYKYPFDHPVVILSTLTPSVDTVLFGPVFHANIWGRYSGFVRVLIGGEHTGGTGQNPSISFAGGFGGGAEYRLSSRFSLRASGDETGASFTVVQPVAGDSPHKTWNPRAAFGVVYRF